MRRITVGLLLATLALALSACGPGSRPQAGPSSPAESGTPTAPAPSDEPSPSAAAPSSAASAVLVQFGRQGGFAGVSDQLTVRQDGGFTLVRTRPAVNRTGRLSAADLAELRQVLRSADIAGQSRVQAAKGNDLYTYHVVYDGAEILAMDGGVDERLKPVVGTLSGIVGRYSA